MRVRYEKIEEMRPKCTWVYINKSLWCMMHHLQCTHTIVFVETGKTMVVGLIGIRGIRSTRHTPKAEC